MQNQKCNCTDDKPNTFNLVQGEMKTCYCPDCNREWLKSEEFENSWEREGGHLVMTYELIN